jgi:putative transposase
MGRAITIRTDLGTAADLRRMAKQQSGRRTALRLLAIANAMEGMSRAQAARSAGIERQSLCDAIKRFNAEGIAGLVDRPKGHRRERLSEAEQAVLINLILRGPDPDRGEPCAWTLPDLSRSASTRACARSRCRVWCAGSGFPARRPGPSIRRRTPRRPKPSKKGVARGRKGDRKRPSGPAHCAVVHG